MKPIILIITALFLSGCAGVSVTPPVQQNVLNSQVYQLGYDDTWSRAIDWFADHNVQIDKIEKSSGLITAKYPIVGINNDVNCGEIKARGTLSDDEIKVSKYGTINVTVRSISTTSTKVNVNFFGEYSYSALDTLWSGAEFSGSGQCISVGTLESNILSYIQDGESSTDSGN